MLFLIPTATDAPSYHIPFATIGTIIACIVVYVLQVLFPDAAEFFILRHHIFNPITWFSSSLMHADIGHLLGNMIFLALFGGIVEGKIGWWRFLAVCALISLAANVFEQTLLFAFSRGGSLGASGVIYGLMAIALVWAPENKITFAYFGKLVFYPVAGTFSLSILEACFAWVAIEFLKAWFFFVPFNSGAASAFLHLIGFVPGAIIGYVMVKKRLVDCEGYDLMSIRSGNSGKRVKTIAQEKEERAARKRAQQDLRLKRQQTLERVEEYIQNGHYELAFRRHSMIKRKGKPIVMPEDQYVRIINGMWSNLQTRSRAIPIMESYLEHHTRLRNLIVLKLARHALEVESNPDRSIELLKRLDLKILNSKQKSLARSIHKSAMLEAA